MEFIKVDKSNIDLLFDLNLQLAVDENQKDLFTAIRDQYSEAFLGGTPLASGFLCFIQGQPVGFYIYCFKFASYLGSRVFYIEDLFFKEEARVQENKMALLRHAIEQSKTEQCCRVEMRVLKTFNFGYDIIADCGFEKILKWDVYRFTQKC